MNDCYKRMLHFFFTTIIFSILIAATTLAQTNSVSSINAGDTAVIVEAEFGGVGNNFRFGDDGDISYVAITTNYIGTTNPEEENSLITFDVTFEDSGTYNLFARLWVGAAGYDDDSFFYSRGFGEMDVTSTTDWVFVNGLAGAGFSSPSEVVDGPGTLGSQIWKWVNVTKNFYQGNSPEKAFYVDVDNLLQTFQIAGREDGLRIDKLAFGKANLYFTVEALENGFPGSPTPPEPDSTKFYAGPPLAQGSSKFLGNVKSSDDESFRNYWNQLTPGNEGKWGSVAGTSDTTRWNWAPLDALYNYAQEHELLFKDHTLIWGNQQPSWISTLDSARQYDYIETWIRMVGERYPDMDMVDVVNEPLTNHNPPDGRNGRANYKKALGGDGETGWDWVINSFILARKYLPNTELILNDYGIINDNNATTSYLKIINLLNDRGLIDGIGVQGHRFALENAASSTLENNLDRLAATGLPIYISELDLGNLRNEGTPNDDQQLQLYQRIFPILWEHPGVQGITLWGYIEGQMWQTTCHLILRDGTWRPAMTWLADYLRETNVGVEKTVDAVPAQFHLKQNYPNPFNSATVISYTLPAESVVQLVIFDMMGREVAMLLDEKLPAGFHSYQWDAANLSTGVYFYQLRTNTGYTQTNKLLLLK